MSVSVEKLLQDAIQVHQQGGLKKADALYQKVLTRKPRLAEAIHMRGVLKFQQGHYDYAEKLLLDALKLDKENPWIKYHQGDLYRTKGDFFEAEQCFKEAVKLGASDGDVFFMLANTQFEQENFSSALDNYLKAVSFSADDPEYRLNLANCYEALNEPDKAVESLKIVLNKNPDHAVHLQLIDLLARTGKFLEVSERISGLPNSSEVDLTLLLQSINTLFEVDRAEDASRLLDIVVALDVSNESPDTLDLVIGSLVNVGRYDDARQFLDITCGGKTPNAVSWFQLGLCEQTSGAFEKAAQYHRRALECEPTFGRAAYSLAINGKSDVTETEQTQWREIADRAETTENEKIQFLFAAARTLDARGETETAFATYQQANAMHHALEPFDPDRWDSYIDSVIEHFSPSYFKRIATMGDAGDGLVFIVGMPRSGSTLLEYQLTKQFGATALGEHPTARRLFMDLPRITEKNLTVAQCAEHLEKDHCDYLRREYLISIDRQGGHTQVLKRLEANELFVDKMLGNFLRLGMLAAMFPKAKVLHCARDAEATCVSCYTNLFARGLKFTYDLYGLGRAWHSYQRLMQYWQDVLPMSLYNVSYQKVVTEPDLAFREISEFLGVQTKPADASSVSGSGAINTASFYQARQPISKASLDGWKRFEPYLDPLMRGLGR